MLRFSPPDPSMESLNSSSSQGIRVPRATQVDGLGQSHLESRRLLENSVEPSQQTAATGQTMPDSINQRPTWLTTLQFAWRPDEQALRNLTDFFGGDRDGTSTGYCCPGHELQWWASEPMAAVVAVPINLMRSADCSPMVKLGVPHVGHDRFVHVVSGHPHGITGGDITQRNDGNLGGATNVNHHGTWLREVRHLTLQPWARAQIHPSPLARSAESMTAFFDGGNSIGMQSPPVAPDPAAVDLANEVRKHGLRDFKSLITPSRRDERRDRTWRPDHLCLPTAFPLSSPCACERQPPAVETMPFHEREQSICTEIDCHVDSEPCQQDMRIPSRPSEGPSIPEGSTDHLTKNLQYSKARPVNKKSPQDVWVDVGGRGPESPRLSGLADQIKGTG